MPSRMIKHYALYMKIFTYPSVRNSSTNRGRFAVIPLIVLIVGFIGSFYKFVSLWAATDASA